jgi:hypothetical protein
MKLISFSNAPFKWVGVKVTTKHNDDITVMFLFLYASDSEQIILETVQILTCSNGLAPVPVGGTTLCDYL